MVSNNKVVQDVLWYWYWLQKYNTSASLISKCYVLDHDLRKFLLEVTHPPVHRLLSEFIAKEEKKYL